MWMDGNDDSNGDSDGNTTTKTTQIGYRTCSHLSTVGLGINTSAGKIRKPIEFTPPRSNCYHSCENVWINDYLCLIVALKPSS